MRGSCNPLPAAWIWAHLWANICREVVCPFLVLVLEQSGLQVLPSESVLRKRIPKSVCTLASCHDPSERACASPPLSFLESMNYYYYYFLKFYLFIYLFMAVLGLHFCARAFSSCGKWGPLFIAVRGPLSIAASLVAEHRLQTRRLSNCGSRA